MMRLKTTEAFGLRIGVVCACVAFAGVAGVSAQAVGQAEQNAAPEQVDLPDPSELFAGHWEAVGGWEKVQQIEGRTVRGVVERPGQGPMAVELVQKPPMLWKLRMFEPGVLDVTTGYNGEGAWRKVKGNDPVWMTGLTAIETRENSKFFGEAHAEVRYNETQTVGLVEDQGRQLYAVRGLTKIGTEVVLGFDAETKLLSSVTGPVLSASGPLIMQQRYLDYRPVDGILVPHRMEQITQADADPIVLRFTKFVLTVEESESFDPPAEIGSPPAIPATVQEAVQQAREAAAARAAENGAAGQPDG